MGRINTALLALNRGEVGRKLLARVDMDRLRLSAKTKVNFVPRAMGSMSLRPGFEYRTPTYQNKKAKTITFFRSTTQIAALELTDGIFRPLINDAAIVRPYVSTAVTSSSFESGTGWTITNYGAASSSITGGRLSFSAVPINSYSTCTQTLSIAAVDRGVEHGVRIVISRGRIKFKVGATAGEDDLFGLTTLSKGEHSLAFTPEGAEAHIHLESIDARITLVDSVTIEPADEVRLSAPWDEADLSLVRTEHSGDVMYADCFGYAPMQFERRSDRSWSLVNYLPNDGPFRPINTENIKFSIDVARGNGTLTCKKDFFKAAHVGTLFRIFTAGYNLPFTIGSEDSFTPAIRINGVGTGRLVQITITGTFTGNLTLQRSYIDESSGFTDIETYTGATSDSYTDTADNTAAWFRVGFKDGAYTSGSAVVTLRFGDFGSSISSKVTSTGGRTGVCRVVTVNSATEADVEIISEFSSNATSDLWYEGAWSDLRGWPSAPSLHEGRLFHGDKQAIIGSVSDGYSSFSLDVEGEAGVIQRSIGYGPIQIINGFINSNRLIALTEGSEVQVRSSSFEEPLTPTNFSLKDVSTFGSARVEPRRVDSRGFFVHRSGQRLMEVAYSVERQDYATRDLNAIHPDLNLNNPIIHIAVQRMPDTRIHCVRADGTVAVILYEPDNEVMAWFRVETDGDVEDVYVKPNSVEDDVYYVVKRTINGVTKRYHERWAREDECVGGTLNKQADSFYQYSGASSTTINGLTHLAGESVVVWANGKGLGTYTVSATGVLSGLSEAVTSAIIGLGYTAQFESAKLAYGAMMGTALVQKKRLHSLGLICVDTHKSGLRYGDSFTTMYDLPAIEEGKTTDPNQIWEDYDNPSFSLGGEWRTDSRLCLQAQAPYPATVLAAVIGMETNDK